MATTPSSDCTSGVMVKVTGSWSGAPSQWLGRDQQVDRVSKRKQNGLHAHPENSCHMGF